MFRSFWVGLVVLVGGLAGSSARGDLFQYYVGRDVRPTMVGGAYDGLPNPNFNRVTFLYAHTYPADPANNHYHSKGTYSYTGPNLVIRRWSIRERGLWKREHFARESGDQ